MTEPASSCISFIGLAILISELTQFACLKVTWNNNLMTEASSECCDDVWDSVSGQQKHSPFCINCKWPVGSCFVMTSQEPCLFITSAPVILLGDVYWVSTVFSGHHAIKVFVSWFCPTTLDDNSSYDLSPAGNLKSKALTSLKFTYQVERELAFAPGRSDYIFLLDSSFLRNRDVLLSIFPAHSTGPVF